MLQEHKLIWYVAIIWTFSKLSENIAFIREK